SPGEVCFTPVQESAHFRLALEHIPRLIYRLITNLSEGRPGAMETPAGVDVPEPALGPYGRRDQPATHAAGGVRSRRAEVRVSSPDTSTDLKMKMRIPARIERRDGLGRLNDCLIPESET